MVRSRGALRRVLVGVAAWTVLILVLVMLRSGGDDDDDDVGKGNGRIAEIQPSSSSSSSSSSSLAAPITNALKIKALVDLAKRRVPLADVDKIRFDLTKESSTSTAQSREYFSWTVNEDGTNAKIQSNSPSGLSKGLGDFYRHFCRLELVSWANGDDDENNTGSRPTQACLDGSSSQHDDNRPRHRRWRARFPIRYGWNAVTFSYSSTWWTWERYEREIDWLALRGVNLLLAHEGQEYIMQLLFKELCSNPEDYDANFFTHETYFAWNRMGNIRAVGGPPSQAYIESRHELQLRILARMQALGISPVLPAFNGFAPCLGKRDLKLWSGFSPEYSAVPRIAPTSPDFARFAQRMIELQLELYADKLPPTSHVVHFSLDSFNENSAEGMEDHFAAMAQGLVRAPLQAASRRFGRRIKFVMQMWFLANDWRFWTKKTARRFLAAFPANSLLLLDLHADKRSQVARLGLHKAPWFKQQVVFCVLHNFGGGGGLAGELDSMLDDLSGLEHGIGFAPEGIEQNELVYDTVLHAAWQEQRGAAAAVLDDSLDLSSWLSARYRLGGGGGGNALLPDKVLQAWQLVVSTAYARQGETAGWSNTKSLFEVRPVPFEAIRSAFMPTLIDYPADTFVKATQLLIEWGQVDSAYVYDVVQFARQMLSDQLIVLMDRLEHVSEDDQVRFRGQVSRLLDLVGQLLASHPKHCFQLQPKHFIELSFAQQRHRKQLLTMWHEDNDGSLADYGSQQLGGALFNQVHKKRWDLVLEVEGSLLSRANVDKLVEAFRKIELAWVNDYETDSDECTHLAGANPIAIALNCLQFAELGTS